MTALTKPPEGYQTWLDYVIDGGEFTAMADPLEHARSELSALRDHAETAVANRDDALRMLRSAEAALQAQTTAIADAIAALASAETERDALKAKVADADSAVDYWSKLALKKANRARAAEARVARLREALEKVAGYRAGAYYETVMGCAQAALAADANNEQRAGGDNPAGSPGTGDAHSASGGDATSVAGLGTRAPGASGSVPGPNDSATHLSPSADSGDTNHTEAGETGSLTGCEAGGNARGGDAPGKTSVPEAPKPTGPDHAGSSPAPPTSSPPDAAGVGHNQESNDESCPTHPPVLQLRPPAVAPSGDQHPLLPLGGEPRGEASVEPGDDGRAPEAPGGEGRGGAGADRQDRVAAVPGGETCPECCGAGYLLRRLSAYGGWQRHDCRYCHGSGRLGGGREGA